MVSIRIQCLILASKKAPKGAFFYVYLTHKAAILYNINANDLQNGGE
jgi:hypothetical protein